MSAYDRKRNVHITVKGVRPVTIVDDIVFTEVHSVNYVAL